MGTTPRTSQACHPSKILFRYKAHIFLHPSTLLGNTQIINPSLNLSPHCFLSCLMAASMPFTFAKYYPCLERHLRIPRQRYCSTRSTSSSSFKLFSFSIGFQKRKKVRKMILNWMKTIRMILPLRLRRMRSSVKQPTCHVLVSSFAFVLTFS